jgi:hypothetical protein
VTPDGIRAFWGAAEVGLLGVKKYVDGTNDWIDRALRNNQDSEPFTRGLQSVFTPRGGVGLYLHKSSASFRRVVIEPLD